MVVLREESERTQASAFVLSYPSQPDHGDQAERAASHQAPEYGETPSSEPGAEDGRPSPREHEPGGRAQYSRTYECDNRLPELARRIFLLPVRFSSGTLRPMAGHLTRRQHDVLTTIARLERDRGYAPSVRDLGRELGLSPATVQEHLVALEKKGHVRRSGAAFGLEVLSRPEPTDVVEVPVRGAIAAGQPIEAVEERDETVPVPKHLVSGECFFLRVRGDSMKDDHILDGDLVLVRRQSTVGNGEIAVALLPDGTVTLKRVYRERGRFRLQPANEAHAPIYVTKLRVQGKVVSVHRTFV